MEGKAGKTTLSALKKRLDELPVLPAVLVRLMAQSTNAEAYYQEVLALAESDPSFASRIISAANSSASAPISPVEGLPNAVARLGSKQIGQIVTGLAVTRVFVPTTVAQNRLWIHSIDVALLSREMAKISRLAEAEADTMYLAGLLHDVGRFVMLDEAPSELETIEDGGWETPSALIETELEICGFDHAKLGWMACERWGLPDRVSKMIRDHHLHDPDAGSPEAPDHNLAIALIQLADEISMVAAHQPGCAHFETAQWIETLLEKEVSRFWTKPPIRIEEIVEFLPDALRESTRLAGDLGIGLHGD